MRISDWSSDVCSSDLLDQHGRLAGRIHVNELVPLQPGRFPDELMRDALLAQHQPDLAGEWTKRELEELPHGPPLITPHALASTTYKPGIGPNRPNRNPRQEERRVGKEGGSPCRSQRSQSSKKK